VIYEFPYREISPFSSAATLMPLLRSTSRSYIHYKLQSFVPRSKSESANHYHTKTSLWSVDVDKSANCSRPAASADSTVPRSARAEYFIGASADVNSVGSLNQIDTSPV